MYYVIDQQVLRSLPKVTGPSMNFSVLNKIDMPVPVRGFGIKLVLEGTEQYTVDGQNFLVGSGQFLLLNDKSRNHASIDVEKPVKGLCIELTSEIMKQAVSSAVDPGSCSIDHAENYFSSDQFIEQLHHVENTFLGRILQPLAKEISLRPLDDRTFHVDMYHSLAEAVIKDHAEILFRSRSIGSIRSGTRKDLFRRIRKAKEVIHARYSEQLDTAELAREACMSEFHFYRTFKAWTGFSPHAYLIQVRLRHAHSLLQTGGPDITAIALACGFTNIHSFSRTFKKWYGMAPSRACGRSRRI